MGNYPSVSVIEEAMKVLESDEGEIKKSHPSGFSDPSMPDISTIEIDEGCHGITPEPKKRSKKQTPKKSTPQNKQLEEIAQKLIAIGQQLLETVTAGATTCGSIGMNMAGPQKDPMKPKKKKLKKIRKLSNGYLRAS